VAGKNPRRSSQQALTGRRLPFEARAKNCTHRDAPKAFASAILAGAYQNITIALDSKL